MKNRFRLISALCTVSLTTIMFAGCAKTEDAPKNSAGGNVALRFSWWGGDARHKATLDTINLYTEKNPNVKIEAEYGGFDGYRDKLATQLASKTAPDLIQIDSPWIYDFARQGELFYDINALKDTVDMKGFDEKFIKNYATINGKIQGLPMGINAVTIFTNKDLLKSAGIDTSQNWDWNKILEDGKKVHEQNNKNYLLNLEQNALAEFVVIPYVIQKTGQQWIKDDFTMGFDKATLTEALEYIKQLFDQGITQPAEQSLMFQAKAEQNPAWANKQFGGAITWLAGVSTYTKPLGDSADVALFPIPKDAKNTGLQTRPATLLSINKNSDNVEEAAKFMNFFFNDKDAALALGDVRAIPPVESARQALIDAKKISPLAVKAADFSMEKAGLAYNGPSNNEELRKILISAVENIAFNKLTPDKAADDMIKRYQDKLTELKEANK